MRGAWGLCVESTGADGNGVEGGGAGETENCGASTAVGSTSPPLQSPRLVVEEFWLVDQGRPAQES